MDELKALISEGKISLEAVQTMTGIEPAKLEALLADDSPLGGISVLSNTTLSPEENTRLSVLSSQLQYGLEIADDDRLQGILDSLTSECGLTVENIASLVNLDPDVVQAMRTTPGEAPLGAKYAFALRGSYLINAANQARNS